MHSFKNLPNNIMQAFNLNDNELNGAAFFITLYNEIPSMISIMEKVDVEKLTKALYKEYKIKSNEGQIFREIRYSGIEDNDMVFNARGLLLKEKLIIGITEFEQKLFYSEDLPDTEIDRIKKLIRSCCIKDKKKPSFYMVGQSYGSLSLMEFDLKLNQIDIGKNYNEDFSSVNKTIIEFLEDGLLSGLVLLHGLPGTGKTTYIRHLVTQIEKKFIFIPLEMTSYITSPEFIPFISQHKDSIIILEDCEKLIKSRDQGNTGSEITQLLNLSDGLFADALGIKLICSFNTDMNNIDNALLRKGRLRARYEFGKLETGKVNELLKLNGHDVEVDDPLTIAEVYNFGSTDFTTKDTSRKIGF